MAKVKVPVFGTVGKAVFFDPQAGARAEAAVDALALAISEGIGGTIQHRSLQGLQIGNDHPQYAMWQAPESIQGLWDFATIPLIQGETLAEYIEDVVGQDFFDFLQDTSSVVWTYFDTDGELEANVPPEFVEDTVAAFIDDSDTIYWDYNDSTDNILAMVNETAQYDWTGAHTFTGQFNVGNPGTESGSVQLDGATYSAVAKINEFGGTNDAALILHRHAAGAAVSANMLMSRARGAASAHSDVQDGDTLGRFIYAGWHTASYYRAAEIDCEVDGTPGAGDMPGRLIFKTSPDGSNTPAEVLRLTAAKHVDMRNDNAELRIGAGQDLRLYHDGTNSVVRNDTGALQFNMAGAVRAALSAAGTLALTGGAPQLDLNAVAPAFQLYETDQGTDAKAWRFGAVGGQARFMLYDDAGNFGSNGWVITRSTTTPTSFRLPLDSYELQIGAGQDLRLYHDGTDSYIENDTGNLVLRVGGELVLEEVTTGTGAVTCTLGTNAPAGVGTTTPTTWMTLIVSGTTYFIPLWT